MIALAGDLAVRLYRDTPLRHEPTDSDLDAIVHAAALAADAGEDAEAHIQRLAAKTFLILRVYWDRLLGLADELLDKRKLTGPEIKALLRSPRPSS
ncbi:hypothetical protein [Tautonia plasticadhaerens]|uniref:Uncharacterized protein n=1 Tax=Tautonia plasticadhaerens TaxID=2527974 RepID=A0A518H4B0_9BACT|nr:hypothetical protein [Tautonia plasticadhaerens]QDV35672.1 hypothetical protein ElP_35760 [Tautonia plasticadhaerens]